jgi:putative transposase
MRYGYVYLVCLIDVFSRKIMGWNLSTLLDTQSCLEALEDALLYGGKPEIINSDQGCQFTSDMWTSYVRAHDILISMDGKGQYLC